VPMAPCVVVEVGNYYKMALSWPYVKVALGTKVGLVSLIRLNLTALCQLIGSRIDDVTGKRNSQNTPQLDSISPKLS
jgi:hypothetical protein